MLDLRRQRADRLFDIVDLGTRRETLPRAIKVAFRGNLATLAHRHPGLEPGSRFTSRSK